MRGEVARRKFHRILNACWRGLGQTPHSHCLSQGCGPRRSVGWDDAGVDHVLWSDKPIVISLHFKPELVPGIE